MKPSTIFTPPPGVPGEWDAKRFRCAWMFRDRSKIEIGCVARFDDDNGKACIPFFNQGKRGWKRGAPPEPRPLYGLDMLGIAASDSPIFIVEGEKCAAALHSIGLTAISSLGGANSPQKTDWTPLEKFERVIILPDNDTPGKDYSDSIVDILSNLPGQRRLEICELPGLPHKGDIVDWLHACFPEWDCFEPIPHVVAERLQTELLAAIEENSNTVSIPGRNLLSIVTAASLFDRWKKALIDGEPPKLYTCGPDFEGLEIGPGQVTLIGGAPGAGKTALTMQVVIDAMRADPSLRVVVSNVEMSPTILLDRQLARLAGIPLDDVRFRRLSRYTDRVEAAAKTLCDIAGRLTFHTGPSSLWTVDKSMREQKAGLVVLDYIQRFSLGDDVGREQRQEIDSMMAMLRQWADAGSSVVVVAAVARQRGKSGSDYDGLGIASFRGSSELEYGADSAWVLNADDTGRRIVFSCVKNRYGDTPKLLLNFDRARQRFARAA